MNKSNFTFKNIIIAAILFSMIFMFSCSSSKVVSNSLDRVPDGFSSPNMILLIQKNSPGIGLNRKKILIDNSFKKYYFGKYEIVSPEELCMNSKYKDKKTFRYIFHDEKIEAPSGSTKNYTINYHLYDRLTANKMTVPVYYNLLAEATDAIAKKLNKYLPWQKSIVSAD